MDSTQRTETPVPAAGDKKHARELIAEADGWVNADLVARHAMSALDTIRRLRNALEAALPGDLTDETIERAARALYEIEPAKHGREHLGWDEISKVAQRMFAARARAVLAAARVAPVTPSEPEWEHGTAEGEVLLARIMNALAYLHCKSTNPKADSPITGYHAMSEDQREFLRECQRGAAEQIMRTWNVATTHAPSPDREKLIAQRREVLRREFGYRIRTAVAYRAMKGYRELPSQARADFIQNEIAFAVSNSEGKLAALAVPPVVNEAKLAEIIHEHRPSQWRSVDNDQIVLRCCRTDFGRLTGKPRKTDRSAHELWEEHLTAVLVERQREWLGDAR